MRLAVLLNPTLVPIDDLSLRELFALELEGGRRLVLVGHLPRVFNGERQIGLAGDQVGRALDLDTHRSEFGDIRLSALGLDGLLDNGPCLILGKHARARNEQAPECTDRVHLQHRVLLVGCGFALGLIALMTFLPYASFLHLFVSVAHSSRTACQPRACFATTA